MISCKNLMVQIEEPIFLKMDFGAISTLRKKKINKNISND